MVLGKWGTRNFVNIYKMDGVQVKISPRMLCPCGKGCKPMSVEERRAYDEAVRRIVEARSHRVEQTNEAPNSLLLSNG